jgi:hypothetical protein
MMMLTGYRLDVSFSPDGNSVAGDVSPYHTVKADVASGSFPPYNPELHRTYHFVETDVERLLELVKTWLINYTRNRYDA